MDGGFCLFGICGVVGLGVAAVAATVGLVVYLILRWMTNLHPNVPIIIACLVSLTALVISTTLLTIWVVP